MKIVVLADLHGNMVATEAMERELDRIQPDDVWFLGDEDELKISGLRFRLVHGRFLDPMYIANDPDEKLRAGFCFHDGRPKANGLICADTHTPFIRPLEDGYAINTGSVGNNLGVPRAHALLLEGDNEPATLRMTILSVPYDNRKAAEIAELYPDLPKKEAYQKEVTEGVYSR